MLKYLRNKETTKKIFIALALIIIPAFVLWGVGGGSRSGSGPSYAGVLFGKKVSLRDYGRNWRAVKNEALMRYPNFNEIYEQLDLENRTWDRLILIREAAKKRIKVTDDEVINTIRSFPFLSRGGKFDAEAYERLLKNVFQISPREYEEDMRDSLKIAKLVNNAAKGVKVSDDELLKRYKEENEKIKITYILEPSKDFADKVNVSEREIEEYYNDNPLEFKMPARVNIEYMEFGYPDYIVGIEVDDEILKQYYELHKKEFERSESAAEAPEKRAPEAKTFEEVKEEIRTLLTAERAKAKSYSEALGARSAIEEGSTFEKAAEKYKKPVKKTGYFSKKAIIPGIGWNPVMAKTAFNLKKGEAGRLISPDNAKSDANYIIRLAGKEGPGITPISEVREDIREKVKLAKINALARESMKKYESAIKEKVEKGASFKDAAASLGLKPKESEYITRTDYIKDIGPAAVIKEVFGCDIGGISPVISAPGGACIAQLTDLEPIDKAKFEEIKEDFGKRYLEIKKAMALDAWFADLKTKAGLVSNIQ